MRVRRFSFKSDARIVGLIVFALIALLLIGGSYLYYVFEIQDIILEKHQTLATAASIKAKQIEDWRHERIAEIERDAKDALIIKSAADILTAPENQVFKKELKDRLTEEVTADEGEVALLFDTKANLLAANDRINPATRQAMDEALADNKPVFSNFFRASDGSVDIDLAAPVRNENGHPIAVLVLRNIAASHLYPLIESWPVQSPSAETILVQREGDEVVLLNDLKDHKNSALVVHANLKETNLPSVQAALGKKGFFEGRDYRNVKVLGYLLPITDSPWFLVTKVNSEEVFIEARSRVIVVSLIVGVLMLIIVGLVSFLYRLRQSRILKNLSIAESHTVVARDAMRESEERNQAILHTAMDGFLLVNREGEILEVNEAYCQMTGYSKQELLSMRIDDLEIIQTEVQIKAQMQKIKERGMIRFESKHRRKDGSVMDVQISIQHRSSDETFLSFYQDITARKAAEARVIELSRMNEAHSECSEAILHSKSKEELFPKICRIVVERGGMPMAWIGIIDQQNRVVSPIASYGCGTEYLSGIDITDRADLPSGLGPVGTSIRTNEPVCCHDFQADPNLSPWRERAAHFGWKSCMAIPLKLRGGTIGALCFYSMKGQTFGRELSNLLVGLTDNISFALESYALEEQRKQNEKAILESNRQLEQAVRKALDVDRAKSEFLGVMSHELRTPLNGILGFSELLLENRLLPPDVLDKVSIIQSSGASLLKILQDILAYSQVDGGDFRLHNVPFSLSELAWKVIRIVEPEASVKNLKLSVVIGENAPGTLKGDPERIQQVLLNLLRNAVKFTDKGRVCLSIDSSSLDGDMNNVTFAVEDTGLGIVDDQKKNIFLPFTQADSTLSRKHDGIGLGLSISTRIVERMGSSIALQSEMGKGSIFSFELKLPSASSKIVATPGISGKLGNLDIGFSARFPAKILIVEDNPINLKLGVMLLGNLGYKDVLLATDGSEAVQIVKREKVDLIFMDLQMPKMDGMAATEQIRSWEAENRVERAIIIVALTANVDLAVRTQCFKAGMNHYVGKPFNSRSLADAVALIN